MIAAENLKKTSGTGGYAEVAIKAANNTAKLYSSNQLTRPEVIGKVILKAVTARNPKRRYVKGFGAKPSLFIRKWFGDGVYELVVKSVM